MAKQWLTGSGVPSTGIGQVTDYYRDTISNLVYYRENAFTWVVVPAFTPSPDGIGTTWLHGATAPLTAQGSDGDYFYEDTHKIVYRKEGSTWVAKGSLDFIGTYGVQWGNGLGAPVSNVPLDALPAGSFYLDVVTSDIYFKETSMVWELKGQLGLGSTGLDAVATAADRVQTGLDAVATAADRAQTGLDAIATAADRVQTGLDVIATAADRVQTGLDVIDTAAAAAGTVIRKFATYTEQMAYVGAYVDGQKADVLGYYSAGDGGYIQMYWSASSTATHNGVTVRKPTSVSGAGRWLAINNTASLKQRGVIGNSQYYAVSDWYTAGTAYYRGFADLAAVQAVYPHVTASTDSIDFAVIQSAINASYNGDLIIPKGGYNLRAARADKILEIRDRINIIGSYGTDFLITSDTPNSQDVIQINPTSTADEGVELHNIWIYELSGTPARDILRVNLDLTHGLKKLRLFGCLFRTLNAAGRAVRILNPANINANGLFSTNIERSEFSGGLFAEGLGDSVRIKDNTFTGLNIGIDIAMLPAAAAAGASAKLSIKDNNITSSGGAIAIRRGRGVTIADNNIEQLVDLTGNSCISLFDLDEDFSGKSVITNNKIEPNDPASKCNGISLFRCKNTAVVNNQIGTSAKTSSYTTAVLVSECENVQVHYNDSYVSTDCFGVLIDVGSKNTSYKKGKIRPVNVYNFTEIQSDSTSTSGFRIIPALLNGWVAAGVGQFQQAQFTKNDGVVSLDGVIARAMTTGNHLIMTLPVGMRPSLRVMSICHAYYADGSLGFCNVRVDPDGSVYLSKRSNTVQDILELSLNGINFNAADA